MENSATDNPAPVLVLAIGNESRGDDAIAPLLLREFRDWLEKKELSGKFELLEDFQLQVEHAADLEERELVLFIDAGMDTPAPYTFYRARLQDGQTVFSHAISPEAVLTTYSRVYEHPPPPSFVLCIRGERFELGEAPSAEAKKRMAAAAKLLHELAQNAETSRWEAQASSNG